MATPSVLTPIGFDTPQLQYSVTPQLAQSLQPDSSPDTTGLNIISEANKSFNQTNQAQADSYKMQAQAMASISQGQAAASQAIGQAENANFQATAAAGTKNIQALANLTGSITNLARAAEANRMASLKAELENNQVLATTELENLQVDWVEGGKLRQQGTQAYRRAVGEILAKRPMQSDTISTLTTKYYAPALDKAKEQDQLVYTTAKEAVVTNRGIEVTKFKQKLIVATAGLADAAYRGEDAEAPFMKQINDLMTGIQNNREFDDLTKLTIIKAGLDQVLTESELSTKTRYTLARQQQGADAVSSFINENSPKVRDGSLPQSTFDDQANEIRRGFGLPEKETTDPRKDLNSTIANLETTGKINSSVRQNIITNTEAIAANREFTQSLALQLFLDPTSLAQVESQSNLDVNAKAGVKLAKEAIEFYGPTTAKHNQQIAEANLTLAKLQEKNYAEVINKILASEQDNTANSLANSLRGLGLGLPPTPAGKTGITQEQIEFIQSNSAAVQRAVLQVVEAAGVAYNNRKDELEAIGFSGNRTQAQANLKKKESVIVEYNKKLEEAKTGPLKQLGQKVVPGQSPNFNGGSQGVQVPLMRRSFRGVSNVTMPFPVGAAKEMADAGGTGSGGYFGDARDGGSRSHDGVDFPVPTSTPALSLVYGTVTEVRRWDGSDAKSYGNLVTVKGDDGREYVYAHLDKITTQQGQRIGPGEKVGLTGETGSPGQPHLHLEIIVGGNPTDPLSVLSTNDFGKQPRQLRSSGSMTGVPKGEARIDPRAIPLGNGQFFLNGKIIKFEGGSTPTTATTPAVDVYKLPEVIVNPEMHNIKIAEGLTPVGWTSTNPRAGKNEPAGYYTFRNAAGGILTQTAFGTGSKTFSSSVGFDGKGYNPPTRTETPPPVEPSRVDASKAGRVHADPIIKGNSEAQRLGKLLSNPNVSALLDALSNAEGNPQFDQGFNYRKIPSLAEHPYVGNELTPDGVSSASGAYQFMGHTWGDMKKALGLQDFSPTSQKIAALKQIEQQGVLSNVAAGTLTDSDIVKLGNVWAPIERSKGSGLSVHSNNNVSAGGTVDGFRSFWETRRKQQGQTTQTAPSAPTRDPRSIPLGNGKYFLNGKVISSNYTPEMPVQASYASASRFDYKPSADVDNYGYIQLDRDPEIADKLKSIAKETGIPPQWLADVAALYGTEGIDGTEELEDMAAKIRGVRIKTPTDLVARILGDPSKVVDLGVHAGRRYDSAFSRFERTTAPTHTGIEANCRFCDRLQDHDVFVPHRAEAA